MSRSYRVLVGGLFATCSLACGTAREPLVPVTQYLAANPGDAAATWAKLVPGARVAVTASEGCVEEVVSSPASTSGAPLVKATWDRADQLYTVVDANLLPGDEGHLALTLHGDQGSLDVLRIPHGKSPTCVALAGDQKGAIASWIGKPLRFQPEQAQCRTLEVAGTNARSTLGDVNPIVFRSLATAPARATGKGAPAVWLKTAEGMQVRADIVATCFDYAELPAPRDQGSAEPAKTTAASPDESTRPRSRFSLDKPAAVTMKRDALALLHVDARQCRKEDTTAGEHVECSTPAGIWQGKLTDDQISLRLVKRTVGAIHLVDGSLVAPQGFAANVVALRLATAEDSSVEQLQSRMREEAGKVLGGDESVRLSTSDADRANLELLVDIGDMQIGAVATRTEPVPHEYQDGTKKEPNPKKREAHDEAVRARRGIGEARQECQDKREQARENYNTCLQAVKTASNLANGKTERTMQATGEAGCTIYKIAMSSNCVDEIRAAKEKAEAAEDAERSTADTIDVPLMRKTTYAKKIFSRTVRGRVAMSGSLDGAPLPPVAQPFEARVEDFEIEGDSAKKIEGHRASAAWLSDERAAVPAVAPHMASWVVAQVRSALGRAALARAKAALHRSGEQVAAGTEALHGLALQIGGDRIRSIADAGTVQGSKAAQIPAPQRTPAECLLVVATLPEGSAGRLTLAAGDIADHRAKPFANIELCSDSDATKVEVASNVEEPVQWATYRVTSFESATTAKPETAAPANAAEAPAGAVRVAPVEAISAFVRPGAATWLVGDIGDSSMGDVFTPGPSVGVGLGVRIGSGWLAYGEWERSFVGVGDKSPVFGLREVSSHGDAFLVGARRTFTGWAVRAGSLGATRIAPLVDLGLGYSVLRQDGTDVAGDSRTLRLPSATARLLFGVSVRPMRWLAIEPVIGSAAGWVNQIEGEQTIGGRTTAADGQLESGSIRATIFGGIGINLDLPLGGPSIAPAPATASAPKANAKR